MEEVETPTEAITETIHHHARQSKEPWVAYVPVGTAIFAVLAAISAMISHHHVNEAMIEQIQSSDRWSYYQARAIKTYILRTKFELLQSLGNKTAETDLQTLERYETEQDTISKEAADKECDSVSHLDHYLVLSRAVTLFQIAIGIAAISVLSEKRRFWILSLGFAVFGLFFFFQGLFFAQMRFL